MMAYILRSCGWATNWAHIKHHSGKKDNFSIIFKPTRYLVPVSLFALSPARPSIGSSTILMQPRQQGTSSGLPRSGKVFTKLSTDTPLVFKRNDRRTNLHWQVYNLEVGEVAPPAKNLLRFQLPAAASSKPAQKVIYNQGFGLRARFRWFFSSIILHTMYT